MADEHEDLEVQKQLFMVLKVILKDGNLANEYIRRFGYTINVKNLREFREIKSGARPAPGTAAPAAAGSASSLLAERAAKIAAANKANAEAAKAAMASKIAAQSKGTVKAVEAPAEDQDPVFATTVNCPICGYNGIVGYELRGKSQQVVQTPLLVPVYTGASGYKTVDYSRLSVIVCPKCLFASPDRKNFTYPAFTGNREEPSSLPVGVILNLKDKTEERQKVLPAALNDIAYFKRERSAQVAIESYRLATVRAESEAELTQPYAYFKMGSYALKIAYIMQCEGQDDTAVLKEAIAHFEKSYLQSECTSDELEMQVVYLMVVLSIRLGDLNKGNSYLTAFAKLLTERVEAMKKNPSLNTKWIEKWQDKARYMWEERENPDLFKLKP